MKVVSKTTRNRALLVAALLLVIFVLMGDTCDGSPSAPPPDSGSGLNYHAGGQIPVDTKAYTLKGWVAAGIDTIVRQSSPGGGSIDGFTAGGTGFVSGSWSGPEQKGKTIVRLHVDTSDYPRAHTGDLVLLKVEDTKAGGLLPLDYVGFKCRAQFEALSATEVDQSYTGDGVWEMDYCRVDGVVIGHAPQATEEPRP